jgi:sphingosine kinase
LGCFESYRATQIPCALLLPARYQPEYQSGHYRYAALNDPVPQNWVSSEDDFYLFWASQVTHATENVHHVPPCKLQDDVFHIVIVRKNVSRYRMAMIILALETGAHVSLDGSEIVECAAYRLEPITPGSFNALDGEVIESGPIQGQVLPAAIQAYHL